MLTEKEILSYLFIHKGLQKKVYPELNNYIKETLNKKILNKIKTNDFPITYEDFSFQIRKDIDLLNYCNQIIKENLLSISNELYLQQLTDLLKKFKYNNLKTKINNGDINIIDNIEKLTKEIQNFNLLEDTDFVSIKDTKKLKELNKEEITEGFFTGFKELDHYVKDCGGFLKGFFTTVVAPPHTGKCVCGNTKIKILENEKVKIITIKELFKKTKIIKNLKDKKFTKSGKIKKISVWTNTGFKEINYILETIPYDVYKITMDQEKNNTLFCADNHIVATLEGLKTIKELFSLVTNIEKLNKKEPMFDLQLKEELFTFKNKNNI